MRPPDAVTPPGGGAATIIKKDLEGHPQDSATHGLRAVTDLPGWESLARWLGAVTS